MEEVTLFEGFIQCDHDGDGITEWRYVLRGGNLTLTIDGPTATTTA